MSEFIRNALTAIAIVASLGVTLGNALIGMNSRIIILQTDVDDLHRDIDTLQSGINEIRCALHLNLACQK